MGLPCSIIGKLSARDTNWIPTARKVALRNMKKGVDKRGYKWYIIKATLNQVRNVSNFASEKLRKNLKKVLDNKDSLW